MAEFLRVPADRISPEALQGLLEEFASRDGTDYGETETPLDQRVAQLRAQLAAGTLSLLFDAQSETWDLLPEDDARKLLDEGRGSTSAD